MAETNVNDVGGRKVLLSENDRYFDCVGRTEMKETDKFPNIYIYIYNGFIDITRVIFACIVAF